MTDDEVASAVIEIVSKRAKRPVARTDRMLQDLGFDSLEQVELIFDLEHIVPAAVSICNLFGAKSVGDIIEWLQFAVRYPEKLAEKQARERKAAEQERIRWGYEHERFLIIRAVIRTIAVIAGIFSLIYLASRGWR